jgi:hypothetical protein
VNPHRVAQKAAGFLRKSVISSHLLHTLGFAYPKDSQYCGTIFEDASGRHDLVLLSILLIPESVDSNSPWNNQRDGWEGKIHIRIGDTNPNPRHDISLSNNELYCNHDGFCIQQEAFGADFWVPQHN